MSSKVSLFAITLNKVEKEWNSDAKLVFEENAMEINDCFPCNQWISTDENSKDPSSPQATYLILGTNGIHSF